MLSPHRKTDRTQQSNFDQPQKRTVFVTEAQQPLQKGILAIDRK
jgi:hypothetical protein